VIKLETITVKLTSPRDYEITNGKKIITVRANRELTDDELGKPLREYEDIFRFVENFDICNIETNWNNIIRTTEEQQKDEKALEKILDVKKEKDVNDVFNRVVTEGIKNTTLSDKLLPTDKEISRIEEKYNHSMNKVNTSTPTIPHIAGIPNPQKRQERIIRNLQEFTKEDIVNMFTKDGYNSTQIRNNSYHDIRNLIIRGKIKKIGDNPNKYRVITKKMGGEISWP